LPREPLRIQISARSSFAFTGNLRRQAVGVVPRTTTCEIHRYKAALAVCLACVCLALNGAHGGAHGAAPRVLPGAARSYPELPGAVRSCPELSGAV